MSGRQRLRQLLDRGRKAVIGLIARCPECVTTSVGGRLEDLQNGIVGWDVLKGDATRNLAICRGCIWADSLCMPAVARNLLGRPAEPVVVKLAVLLRRYDRDLIVELAIFVDSNASLAVRQGMTVKLRRLWLSSELAESLAQQLLVINTNVLIPEENHAPLGD